MHLDPSFAAAYAGLASICNTCDMIRPRRPFDLEVSDRALELPRRAVEFDLLHARHHMVVAWSAAMAQSFDPAEFHNELAIELNPNNPKVSFPQPLVWPSQAAWIKQ